MTTSKKKALTLRDKLSRLSYSQACRMLGSQGKELLREGGRFDLDIGAVELGEQLGSAQVGRAVVQVFLREDVHGRLAWSCSICQQACEHGGALLSLILEEKLALGLARPPKQRVPVESLDEQALLRRALNDREERARSERMTLRSSNPKRLWTDYAITSAATGKTYKLALRGTRAGQSYCSCPDFRKNTLGTCKHILHALSKLKRRFGKSSFARAYVRKQITIFLKYGERVELWIAAPEKLGEKAARIVRPLVNTPIEALPDLLERVRKLERLGESVTIHPDAEELIEQRLMLEHLRRVSDEIRLGSAQHELLHGLLRVELRPYQLDGIAFAVGAGRAVLADDMGLGKTIQAIGTAELLAREVRIERVLVVSPASVKSQWAAEIQRFTEREAQVVLGDARSRSEQYGGKQFFTICNYEQVLRDIRSIEQERWDLIVLDEGQRIKNWEAKTTQTIKRLRSPFALVLSGTPLENRVDELYSVVEFIDERRLAPAFRFYNRHRVVDEKGKVLGYKNLGELRERLAPILLRRTREEVLDELPPRTTEILRIAPTEEQLDLHSAHMQTVSSILHKPFLSEMDLLRLQKALLMCRMAADSTFLVDKQEPGYSSKLERLKELLEGLLAEPSRKIVLFSEWTTMLDLIEPILHASSARFVRLDGSVPQKKRRALVQEFQSEADCRVFLTTNAGATGLNLQAADTIVNVDLPWNPAILEQRIGRAHRMGQKRPVHVFVLVTEDTIEERMLTTLSVKQELAQAVLDVDSSIDSVDLTSSVEDLKRRLEVLIGRKPDAVVDESRRQSDAEQARSRRGERIALAGGRLLDSALSFLGELVVTAPSSVDEGPMRAEVEAGLEECLSKDDQGRPTLTITLPDDAAIARLVSTLTQLMGRDGCMPALRPGAPEDPAQRTEKTRGAAGSW